MSGQDAGQQQLAGAQPTTSLGGVLEAGAVRLQRRFAALHQQACDRPEPVLGFIHEARQQLLRSAALLCDTRKLPPLTQLVQPGGVLDVAATHARALQTAADELFGANASLACQRVPLFNVPDALDVLSTGTYSSLPARIQDMWGPRTLPDAQQARLLSQLNHLLYSHLLKVGPLPPGLELVKVTGGYAVLSCPGLYEVQLSLFQQPYPPQVEEARQAAAAAAAGDGGGEEQQQQPQAGGGTQHTQQQQGEAGAPPAAQQRSEPVTRWQWTLTHAVLLPGAAVQATLRPVQLEQLLRNVRERMWLAADAAAVEAAKQQGVASAGALDGAGGQQPAAAAGAAARPALSNATSAGGPTASMASGLSGAGAGGPRAADMGRGLDLERYAADEVAAPLRVMHGVLRDVAAQMLLHEVRAAATALAGAGSRWEGHLRLQRAQQLTPGIRMCYWQRVPVLLTSAALRDDSSSAGQQAQPSQPAPGASSGTLGDASLPAVEVGIGSDGTVQVLHDPQPRRPLQLQLDSHSVDVEGLLLQAVAAVVSRHLHVLRKAMQLLLKQLGLDAHLQLQLCRYGPSLPQQASAAHQQQAAGSAAAPPSPANHQQQQDAGSSSSIGGGLADTLVVLLEGQPAVSVSLQQWSGRLLLRPGSAYGGQQNLEMGILLQKHQEALQQKQERLWQQLQQRSSSSTEQPPPPQQQQQQQVALACLQELARGLVDLCCDLRAKTQYTSFITAARLLLLQPCHHPRGLTAASQQQMLRALQPAPVGAGLKAASGGAASAHLIYLAMPSMQLPPYMLLLPPGLWSAALQQQQQQAASGAAAGGASSMSSGAAARLAAISPTLCMSLPRRPGGANADHLLLTLCDAQGLPGPLVKRLRLPCSSTSVQDAAPAAAAAAGQRKRPREDDAGETASEQQQPPEEQHDDEFCRAQLLAAVTWCQPCLTFERLLLELSALQVVHLQLMQPQRPHQTQQQQQFAVSLLSVPGVDVYQQLQRRPGCSPPAVGVQEVWLTTGPAFGQWSMHVRGVFYDQQGTQPWAAAGGSSGGGDGDQQQQQQGPWQQQFSFVGGDDVRTALLQLQRLVHMQAFLNALEWHAQGRQALEVVRVSAAADDASWWPAHMLAAAAAAAANNAAGADAELGEAPPAKKARRQQQQQQQQLGLSNGHADGSSAGTSNRAGSSDKLPHTNGMLQAEANGVQRHAAGAAPGNGATGSGGSSQCGLLFHWGGTGLVRLAGYSSSTAVLEVGPPLHADADNDAAAEEGSASRVRLLVQWEPRYAFAVTGHAAKAAATAAAPQPSVAGAAAGSPACDGGSSSTATECVIVHPVNRHSGAAHAAVASLEVLQPWQALGMRCSISSTAAGLPAGLLDELAHMADTQSVPLLLDACALWGCLLPQLVRLVQPDVAAGIHATLQAAAAQAAAVLAAPAGGSAPVLQWQRPSVTAWTGCELTHVRLLFTLPVVEVAAAAAPAAEAARGGQGQQAAVKPEQQAGAGEPPPAPRASPSAPATADAAAGAAGGPARPLRLLQLALDVHTVARGQVRVVASQLAPAGSSGSSTPASSHPSAAVQAACQRLAAQHPGVHLQFVLGPGRWQGQLPAPQPPTHQAPAARRQALASPRLCGFWVQTQHMRLAVEVLLETLCKHVARTEAAAAVKAVRQSAAAAAAAAAAEAAAAGAAEAAAAGAAEAAAAVAAAAAAAAAAPPPQPAAAPAAAPPAPPAVSPAPPAANQQQQLQQQRMPTPPVQQQQLTPQQQAMMQQLGAAQPPMLRQQQQLTPQQQAMMQPQQQGMWMPGMGGAAPPGPTMPGAAAAPLSVMGPGGMAPGVQFVQGVVPGGGAVFMPGAAMQYNPMLQQQQAAQAAVQQQQAHHQLLQQQQQQRQ